MKRGHLAVLALLATAAAWGATFTLVKSVIQTMAPETFIFWRFVAACAILLPLALMRRELTRELLRPGLLLGVLIFGAYWTQTRGLLTISPSRSAFLTGLYVVLVPFFQGKVTAKGWIAAVLAMAGTIALVGPLEGGVAIGDLLTIACAICSALHVITAARVTTHHTATGLAALQVLFVTAASAPLAMLAPAVTWTPGTMAAVLFTGIVTTALAFAALMWGQAHVTATQAAVILSFEPVAAAITSIAFYGEPITAAFVVGALLILTAMLLSQW